MKSSTAADDVEQLQLATRARATIRIAETEVKFTRLVQPTPIVERALRLVEQLAVAP
jgi:hypothetical protein